RRRGPGARASAASGRAAAPRRRRPAEGRVRNVNRGQALVELALCMPVVILLGLGAAGAVEVADAATGLRAATDAAVAEAAREPSAAAALVAAELRFHAVIADYPLRAATFAIDTAAFDRGSVLTGTADVDLGWEAMSFLPSTVHLTATATMPAEQWRTHR